MKASEEETLRNVLRELISQHARTWMGAVQYPMPQRNETEKFGTSILTVHQTQTYTSGLNQAIDAWRKLIK